MRKIIVNYYDSAPESFTGRRYSLLLLPVCNFFRPQFGAYRGTYLEFIY